MKAVGFVAYEHVAISIVNPRNVERTRITAWVKVFEYRLHKNAVVSADFYRGSMALYVTYTDPPGFEGNGTGTPRSVKLNLGEYKDGEGVIPYPDDGENLKEVKASYPEEWARFRAMLPEVYLAATVMET